MKSALNHPLRFFLLLVLVALSPLVFTGTGANPTRPQKQIFARDTASTQTAKPSLSCTDNQSIFGPNYYSQLYVDYAVWSQIKNIYTPNDPTFVNYQYNGTSKLSYDLYVASMQAKGCAPVIDPPTPLSPERLPSYTFDPTTLPAGSTCNTALAYQYLVLYDNQFYANQTYEQAQIEKLMKSAASSGKLSPTTQQSAAVVQTQFTANTRNLAQTYNGALQNTYCI